LSCEPGWVKIQRTHRSLLHQILPAQGPKHPRKKERKRKSVVANLGYEAKFFAIPDKIDQVHTHKPETCEHCEASLSEGKLTGGMRNHYVFSRSQRLIPSYMTINAWTWNV
jgi:hypothetical protein